VDTVTLVAEVMKAYHLGSGADKALAHSHCRYVAARLIVRSCRIIHTTTLGSAWITKLTPDARLGASAELSDPTDHLMGAGPPLATHHGL
jgi:hypothetical protein